MKDKVEEALKVAIKSIYMADNSDYQTDLYRIVEILGGKGLVKDMEEDEDEVYKVYCN
jgi:hypothetical protein